MRFRVTQPLRIRWSGDDPIQASQVATLANTVEESMNQLGPRMEAKVEGGKGDDGSPRLLIHGTLAAADEPEAIEKLRYWLRRCITRTRGMDWNPRLVDPTEATVDVLEDTADEIDAANRETMAEALGASADENRALGARPAAPARSEPQPPASTPKTPARRAPSRKKPATRGRKK